MHSVPSVNYEGKKILIDAQEIQADRFQAYHPRRPHMAN